MLEFLIIAGPNGSGKSSFSKWLSKNGALIFDPDIEKARIERQYPDISDEAVEEELTRVYHHFETRAAGSQQHFTVETNLRNDFLAKRADIFRGNGYETNLIYLALPTVAASMDRVDLRVAQKGHFVSRDSIKYNFEHSFQNFLQLAGQFQKVMLMDGGHSASSLAMPKVLAVYNDGQLIREHADPSPQNAAYMGALRDALIIRGLRR